MAGQFDSDLSTLAATASVDTVGRPDGGASGAMGTPLLQDASAPGSTRASTSRERIQRFAAVLHRTIDKVDGRLSSSATGGASTQGGVGRNVREYGGKLREQITARPLQSAGVAVAGGMVLNKLFARAPNDVRLVLPVQTVATPAWSRTQYPQARAESLMAAAGSHARRFRRASEDTLDRAGRATTLTRTASAVPLQMRLAMERLRARSQKYGARAQTQAQRRPLFGLGALLATGTLVAAVPWLQRRRAMTGAQYVSRDESVKGVSSQSEHVRSGAYGQKTKLPVAAAVVVLGMSAVVGTMLGRR